MIRLLRGAYLIFPSSFGSRGTIASLREWSDRHAQRRALRELPEEMLKDIGLSRADAYRESSKPFWRP